MMLSGEVRVLFRAAAGPRRGFGHLLRCRALARALGVRPLLALRGGEGVVDTALSLGCDVVEGRSPRIIRQLRPDIVIVDDPIARDAARWIGAARDAGCLVVSIHDLGRGCPGGDVVVDGSVTRTASARNGVTLSGPKFAIVDPSIRREPRVRRQHSLRVLISLGGGPRIRMAASIGRAIANVVPGADVRIIGGFLTGVVDPAHPRVRWITSSNGLGRELAQSDVAVLGGGVSLYEACAMGVPAVAVPVVKEQEPTVRTMVRRGAARGRGRVGTPPRVIAFEAARLLLNDSLKARLRRASRHLVDGRGAERVAASIRGIVDRGTEA